MQGKESIYTLHRHVIALEQQRPEDNNGGHRGVGRFILQNQAALHLRLRRKFSMHNLGLEIDGDGLRKQTGKQVTRIIKRRSLFIFWPSSLPPKADLTYPDILFCLFSFYTVNYYEKNGLPFTRSIFQNPLYLDDAEVIIGQRLGQQ